MVHICEENKEDNFQSCIPAPYAPKEMEELRHLKSYDIKYDHWGVGIMVLELLLGTKMILGLDTYNDYKWLLATIYNYVDLQTHLMLTWLMEGTIKFNMRKYTEETLAAHPTLIKENILRLEMAIQDDAHLYALACKADKKWEENKISICENHQLDQTRI